MKKRGVVWKKVLAFAMTLAVVGLLILSGPAKAITVGLTRTGAGNPHSGEQVIFTGKVDIHTTDMVTMKYIVVLLDDTPLDPITNAERCLFYLNGTALSNNSEICDINITSITANYTYHGNGFGYGYGYGFKLSTANTNTSHFDFGYGYQYGYNNGFGSNAYNATVGAAPEVIVNFYWTVPDVDANKDYKVGLGVLVGETNLDRVLFLSPSTVSFSVLELLKPWYSQDADDSMGAVAEGTPVNLHTYWEDDIALDHAIVYTNETGVWDNVSTCALSGVADWCNSTIATTGLASKEVCWKVYAWDNGARLNNTMPTHCFNVTDVTPPYYSVDEDDSSGSVNDGVPVQVSTYWHNVALDTGVFRTNASGSWQFAGSCAMSGTGDWCNATIPTLGHPGERLCWNMWANDTLGLWNNTMPAHCFDVKDITFPTYSHVSDNSGGSVADGTGVAVHTFWTDNVALDTAILRYNASGSWQGVGTCALMGSTSWCNDTLSTAGDAGKHVCWDMYANDTAGHMNNTMPKQCFTVTDVKKPWYSHGADNSGGSVAEGATVSASVSWTDNVALDTALFRQNASGSWQINSCTLTGTTSWCNKTISTVGKAGKHICWNEWANDTAGNLNSTMPLSTHCFTVRDITFPTYSHVSDNSGGSVAEGTGVAVHAHWTDNLALDTAILRTNVTGSWQKGSTCALTGTAAWCNKTISTNGYPGKHLCWDMYANDTANNMNNTMPKQCFTITDVKKPWYSDAADNSVGAVHEGAIVNLSVRWRDNLALDRAFLRTNASGTWTNVSNCTLSGTSTWCIKHIHTDGYAGENICWKMIARDRAGNHNTTMPNHCFSVEDITNPTYSTVSDNSGGSVTEGTSVTASAMWADNIALDTSIFRTNATGSWVTSTCTLTGTSDDCVGSIDTTGHGGDRVCWNMYANDTAGNLNDSMDYQCFDVTVHHGFSDTGSSGSSPSSITQTFASDTWNQVSSVELSLTDRLGDVTVKVETVDTLGTDESGFAIAVPTTSESGVVSMVYKYLKITPSVDLTGNLKSAKIKFEVDHQWLIDNGVDASDVVLLHFKDGVWTELPTSFDGDDGKISNFEAITTGFSYFAISVKKSQQVITPPVCAQVITSAQSPAGACAKFPTPCDVPTGWKVVSQCQSVTVVTTPTTVPQQPPVQKVEGGMTKNEQLALFLGIIVVALLVVWLFVYHRAPPKDKFFESRFKNHPVPHNRGWKKERPPMNWRY